MSESRESVNVEYPVDVRMALRETKEEFARDLLMLAAVKLYELGKISSGKAAALAGTDRVSFLLGLGRYRVSVFNYTSEELEREVAEARARAA
jgi:predicted HTH domain antitoxin